MRPGVILFWCLAAPLVASALAVIVARNPLRSALFLVAHMLVIAVVFLSLSAQYVAAVQVVVYAGAIMVLFLFVIMLLNLGGGVPPQGSRWGVGAGLLMSAGMAALLVGTGVWRQGLAAGKATAATVSRGGSAQAIGYALFDPDLPWLFPFEVASVLLVVAVVGAIVLAKRNL
ncbi:MAG: NADH-quinone oxidoreductase subunit J [Armatimonadetes bacterium]|nr:NADH-quinone oxidoreductase subunit J [Armatimonadota bacterium]